ncbi:MAG: hypothetical protein KC609_19755 [Myxococcales bacterium]|nr:hypothetical protein [Myxococcales bacterium]
MNRNRLLSAIIVGSIATEVLLIVQEGFRFADVQLLPYLTYSVALLTLAINILYDIDELRASDDRTRYLRAVAVEWLLFVPIIATVTQPVLFGFFVWVRQFLVLVRLLLNTGWGHRLMHRMQTRPTTMLVYSFVLIIGIGTILLTFRSATTDHRGATLVDALFTATSATCVTGLIVLNTNDDAERNPRLQSYSLFGQFVILLLIQVGGLGIMTLSTAVTLLLGNRLKLRSRHAITQVISDDPEEDMERILKYIFKMTFVTEGIGSIILFVKFQAYFHDVNRAAYYAIFHSVSAFCNAGFALFGDSLCHFRGDWTINLTISALITLGGLGFAVVSALFSTDALRRPRMHWQRVGVHVKLVVSVSAILIALGTVVYFFADYYHSLKGLPLHEKLLASFFQSVTLRTCGFNTVELGGVHRVTLVVMVVLMFIGASPGGTGGGVKTSTLGVVLLSVRAMMIGRDEVELMGRTIPKKVVYKALSILVISFMILNIFMILLLFTQPHLTFLQLLFEAVSALGTVGLSLGITSELTTSGKIIITFLMFVGRIGPLTLALAVGESRDEFVDYQYPEGKIIVG